ncbi:MAG: redoxin domain-containing protein, partial [Desulfobacterales bacterium]|nr:redoxin domain-containing protein [Desulfobacterales bacterium]
MAEIQKKYDTYDKFNTKVFALSTDSPKQSENIVKKMNFSLTLLCDEDRKVVDLFKLRNPFEHGGIAYPATFIINPEGKICYRSLDGTASRVDLTDELSFIEQLHKDAGHTIQTGPKKSWIIPSAKDNWRMSMNMISQGSFADWKHLFLLPVNMLKIMLRIMGSKIKTGKQNIIVTQVFNAPVETIFSTLTDHEEFGRIFNAKVKRVIDSRDDNKNGLGSVRRIHAFPAPAFEESVITFEPNQLMEYKVSKGSPIKNHRGRMEFTDDQGKTRL